MAYWGQRQGEGGQIVSVIKKDMVCFHQSQKAIQDSTLWGLTKDHSFMKKNNTPIPFNCFHWAMEVFIIKTNIINHYFFKLFSKYSVSIKQCTINTQIYKGIFHYLKIKLSQLVPHCITPRSKN